MWLLRLHLQPLARVDQVQGAVLQDQRGATLAVPAAAARSPALPTWPDAWAAPKWPRVGQGAMPGHSRARAGQRGSGMPELRAPSHPCCPPHGAELSRCRSRRSLGLGLHLRGSELPATQLNWLCHRSCNGIGASRGRRQCQPPVAGLAAEKGGSRPDPCAPVPGRGPVAPCTHLDDGLDSAGRACGGPAGCLHGARSGTPSALGHGLLPGETGTSAQATMPGTALPYSSRTPPTAACVSGSLSTSLTNPTPSQAGVCQQGDSLLSSALQPCSSCPTPASIPAWRGTHPCPPTETRTHAKRQHGTRRQEPARWLGFGEAV